MKITDLADLANTKIEDPIPSLKTSALDIILFCGSPGAGKSTFYWRQLQPLGYGRVNQDILKSVSSNQTLVSNDLTKQRENCLAKAEAMIKEGTSVAVGKMDPVE